jgi:hypothetical protein
MTFREVARQVVRHGGREASHPSCPGRLFGADVDALVVGDGRLLADGGGRMVLPVVLEP